MSSPISNSHSNAAYQGVDLLLAAAAALAGKPYTIPEIVIHDPNQKGSQESEYNNDNNTHRVDHNNINSNKKKRRYQKTNPDPSETLQVDNKDINDALNGIRVSVNLWELFTYGYLGADKTKYKTSQIIHSIWVKAILDHLAKKIRIIRNGCAPKTNDYLHPTCVFQTHLWSFCMRLERGKSSAEKNMYDNIGTYRLLRFPIW